MEPIQIDYNTILYMVMGLFALVGFLRGWLKEGLTTLMLALLTALLKYPDIARTVFGYINNAIRFIWSFIQPGEVPPPFQLDPDKPEAYIGLLIVLVALSYFFGRVSFRGDLTAFSRLAGGVLGLFNGFMVVSLVREYALGFFRRPAEITAEAIPERLSIEILEMPRQSLLQGYFPLVVIGVGVLVLLLIIGSVFRIQPPITRKK